MWSGLSGWSRRTSFPSGVEPARGAARTVACAVASLPFAFRRFWPARRVVRVRSAACRRRGAGRPRTACPSARPCVHCAGAPVKGAWRLSLGPAGAHGGLRATGPSSTITWPQPGQIGGGLGSAGTRSGARQSSSAWMRFRQASFASLAKRWLEFLRRTVHSHSV